MKKTLLIAMDFLELADKLADQFPDWNIIRTSWSSAIEPLALANRPDLIVSEWYFMNDDRNVTAILDKLALQLPKSAIILCSYFNLPCMVREERRLSSRSFLPITVEEGVSRLPDFYEMAKERRAALSHRQAYHDSQGAPKDRGDSSSFSPTLSSADWWKSFMVGGTLLAGMALRVSRKTKEILWDLEALLQLTPLEFEKVIKSRFEAEGYEAKLTKQSHDDGVDIIATKNAPPEGLVVLLIQCKLYVRTPSVPSKDIRDLRGALELEKGTKGILVSTVPLSVPALKTLNKDESRLAALTGIDLIDWLNACVFKRH